MHKQILYMTRPDLTKHQQKKRKKILCTPFQLLHSEWIEASLSLKSSSSTVFYHKYLIVLEKFGGCTACE